MTEVITDLNQWLKIKADLNNNITVGLVMTMGNLHQGHASLIKASVRENNITVLTIFINPMQFNNNNDFDNYPKTLEDDIKLAKTLGVNYILLPKSDQMYPDNYCYQVHAQKSSDHLSASPESLEGQGELGEISAQDPSIMEGDYRPGHFDGMLTIVLKVHLLVKPDRSYFGQKDYQQYILVKTMLVAFFVNTEVIMCPTLRSEQGLALSSRNNRLDAEQLNFANDFPKLLADKSLTDHQVEVKLNKLGFKVDYIQTHQQRRFGAVYLGDVRLIDNILII